MPPVQKSLRRALGSWEEGRGFEDKGQLVGAAHSYTRGLGSFLTYVKLAPDLQLAPAYHAFGALGRETARLLGPSNRSAALRYARMALAASHLADPTRGRIELIERAVREDPDRRLRLISPGPGAAPLTPEARIAGAADARDLLAALLGGDTRPGPQELWPIGSGARLGPGPIGYWKERNRFMRATVPGCEDLDERREGAALRSQADAVHRELRRAAPQFHPGPRPDRGSVSGGPYRRTPGGERPGTSRDRGNADRSRRGWGPE
ncbi:hypothetical protein ACIQ7D_13450 [Streptomyces sp. NPDC096310]|uniref:hypothetical protein n=1 Tax=Streptomyces sp. NPDC096310 TaxID=3366082 RepID=UPI00382E614C